MEHIQLLNFIDLGQKEKEMILEWRNHPEIRKWMYNQEKIKLEEHLNFIDSLKSRNDKLYFLVKKQDEYIGVVDFLDLDKKEIFYGMYANPYSKILGIGRILNEISIDFAFNFLKAKKLKLEVFEDNFQVRNLHKKYKFKEVSQKYVNSKKVICMELKNEKEYAKKYMLDTRDIFLVGIEFDTN